MNCAGCSTRIYDGW